MKRNNTICRASAMLVLASAAFTLLFISTVNPAWAAKPPKPPPPPPAPAPFTYLYLGGLGDGNCYATAINNAGQVIGYSRIATGAERAFIVVPQDTDHDGQPDLWNSADTPTTHSLNPLMTDLGIPAGVAAASITYAVDEPLRSAVVVIHRNCPFENCAIIDRPMTTPSGTGCRLVKNGLHGPIELIYGNTNTR